MKNVNEKIVYGVYCRKSSSEAEDKQTMSILDQQAVLDDIIKKESLNVGIKFPGESQSAHSPGRPIFADLVKNIMDGKINSILVWNANRLSRNPVDAGMIIYLLDAGKLKQLKTPTKIFTNNSDDKFFLNLDLSISKKSSDDNSEAVKRALVSKAKRGILSGVAHIGYLNDQSKDKGNRGWIQDPVRYPLVKKLLIEFLSGKYSVRELQIYADEKLRLKTKQRKRQGGKPIAISYMYKFLKDPIHAGFFFKSSNGEKTRYECKDLEPMISEDDYWKIQSLLGKKGAPRTTNRKAVYNYFARCGTCTGHLSADFKFQMICPVCKHKFHSLNKNHCPACNLTIEKMKNPTILNYTYYYCTNNKKHRTNCPGSTIEERSLETQLLLDMEQKLLISKELSAWCITNIEKVKDSELEDAINIKRNLEQEKKVIEDKQKKLIMLRISNDHSTEENAYHDNIQNELRQKLSLIELKISETNINWMDEARKDFDLMPEIAYIIKNGSTEEKIDALHAFGSNLTISDRKLTVINKNSIEAFKKCLTLAKAENEAFEPSKTLADKGKTEVFASVIPTMHGWRESNSR